MHETDPRSNHDPDQGGQGSYFFVQFLALMGIVWSIGLLQRINLSRRSGLKVGCEAGEVVKRVFLAIGKAKIAQ